MLKIYLTLLLLTSCGLFQKKAPEKKKIEEPVEQKFLYLNKIIHPECVMLLQDFPLKKETAKNKEVLSGKTPRSPEKAFVNLARCTQKTTIVIENDAITTYRPKGEGMAQYKVIANPHPNEFLIRYLWNGGGSGSFTGVQLVGLNEAKLFLIKDFSLEGDRCNGGVEMEKTAHGLRLLRNLTPIDFLERSSTGRSLKLEPYEDLEASATSCYAQEVYAPFKTKDGLSFELLGTKTLDVGETNTDLKTRHSLQGCFNVEFIKLQKTTKAKLLQKRDLEDFARNFKKSCR